MKNQVSHHRFTFHWAGIHADMRQPAQVPKSRRNQNFLYNPAKSITIIFGSFSLKALKIQKTGEIGHKGCLGTLDPLKTGAIRDLNVD